MTSKLSHDLFKVKCQSQRPTSAHKSNIKIDFQVNVRSKFEVTSKSVLSTRPGDSQVKVKVKQMKVKTV